MWTLERLEYYPDSDYPEPMGAQLLYVSRRGTTFVRSGRRLRSLRCRSSGPSSVSSAVVCFMVIRRW